MSSLSSVLTDLHSSLRSLSIHLTPVRLRPPPTLSQSWLNQGRFATLLGWQWPQFNPFISQSSARTFLAGGAELGRDVAGGVNAAGKEILANYEELGLMTMFFNPPLPSSVAWIPFTFRMLALLISLPIFILILLDIFGYLLFRLLDEPFGWTRTIYYKSDRHRALFRKKTRAASLAKGGRPDLATPSSEIHSLAPSPETQTIPLPSSGSSSFSSPISFPSASRSPSISLRNLTATRSRRRTLNSTDEEDVGESNGNGSGSGKDAGREGTKERRERAMMERARASSIGVDGPMMSVRSPSPEPAPGLADVVEELR